MTPDYDDPDQTPDRFGLHIGVVVDRSDPEKVGRVRVRVPGLYEPASPWALPLGNPGGGNDDSGFWWVPQLGSEVGVFLNRGDEDDPRYMPAQWGIGEPPQASDDGDPDVRVIALGTYDVVVDTRGASKKFRIVDKGDGENVIEFDGVNRTLEISATTGISVKSTGQVDIQGTIVTINGVVAGLGQL